MDDRLKLLVRTLLTVGLTTLSASARADWPSDPSQFVTLTPGGRNTLIRSACPDGIGGAFVLWGTGFFGSMHLQRLDELGRPSFPGGTWDLPPEDGAAVEIASDGVGGAVVLLQQYVDNSIRVIRLRRVSSTGSVYWTTTVATTPVPEAFEWTRMVFDPHARRWIIAWLDHSQSIERVRAQSVDLNGQLQWATTPTLERAPGERLALGPVEPDGLGGAWVSCWNLDTGGVDVSLQHIAPDGAAEWGPAGRSLPVSLNESIHQLAGDSQRNLWISIHASQLAGLSDHIQRLRPDGSASFGVNGLALPRPERGVRREAALGVVGPDRVFVAWTDDDPNGTNWTTQLQAVDSAGTWLGASRELRSGWVGQYPGIRVYPLADGGALVTGTPGEDATRPVQRVDADGSPRWPEVTSILQPPLAMVGFESAQEVFVPPFPTGDGGVVSFRTLVDSVVTPEEPHPYYVRAQHLDANGQHGVATTSIATPRAVHGAALFAPVPSPMTSSTRVRFALESEADAELTLHDLSGRRVRTLARGRWTAGAHSVLLTRDDPASASLRPGLYWLRLTASGRSETRELVVLD
jgi:hypothetical protein